MYHLYVGESNPVRYEDDLMDRWAEYNAGTLTPPVVVQRDTVNGGHLIWVWTGRRILGPFQRASWDASVESAILAFATSIDLADPDTYAILCEDGFTIRGFVQDENITTQTNYNIDLTINPTSQQIAAWNLIRPVLAAHLRKVNRVYKKLDDAHRTALRQHCNIFDAVMKLTEDEE